MRLAFSGGVSGAVQRQGNRKARTCLRRAPVRNDTAMRRNNFAHNAQAQAGSLWFRRRKWLENVNAVGNSSSGILDF